MITSRSLVIAVACLVAIALCWFVVGELPIRNWSGEFSEAAWKGSRTDGYGWGTNDWSMADDLVARDVLIGRTQEQVHDLLGEPAEGSLHALEDFASMDYADLVPQVEAMVPQGSSFGGAETWLIREAGFMGDIGILFVIYDDDDEVVGAFVYVD